MVISLTKLWMTECYDDVPPIYKKTGESNQVENPIKDTENETSMNFQGAFVLVSISR
jgi:hypothetical protein